MTCCADIDCDDLKVKLAEAETAYHQLMIGGGKQSVTFGPSKSVSFTAANIAQLRVYINEMKDKLAQCCGVGCTGTSSGPRAPVRFQF